jgi:cytochrome c-type biogenesis protein CcmE
MTRKQTRLTIILASLGVLAMAAGLVLYAIRDTIVFFYAPSELLAKSVAPGTRVRLGGMVAAGTWKKTDGVKNTFVITDTIKSIEVTYVGVVPDLFREGQGVVTEGALTAAGTFNADTVLAKHDENYMPREVADSLKAKGVELGKTAQ